MKVVVIGGTGLIGSMLVTKLSEHGHDAQTFDASSRTHPMSASVSPGLSIL